VVRIEYGGAFITSWRGEIGGSVFTAMKAIGSYFTRPWERRVSEQAGRCTHGCSRAVIGKVYGLVSLDDF